jgi:hypothetical protein
MMLKRNPEDTNAELPLSPKTCFCFGLSNVFGFLCELQGETIIL